MVVRRWTLPHGRCLARRNECTYRAGPNVAVASILCILGLTVPGHPLEALHFELVTLREQQGLNHGGV